MSWKEDKAKRTEHFFKYVYKHKLVDCTACSGSGYYDRSDSKGRPMKCGSCNGTGKERE